MLCVRMNFIHLLFDESASDDGRMIKGVIMGFLACRLWLGCFLSTAPSLGSFSSLSCIQTEHFLQYGWAGFRIGHFLRHICADTANACPVKHEEMLPYKWVGQVLSWKGSYCMTWTLHGICRRLSSRLLTIQLHSHILVACPQVCVTQGSVDMALNTVTFKLILILEYRLQVSQNLRT